MGCFNCDEVYESQFHYDEGCDACIDSLVKFVPKNCMACKSCELACALRHSASREINAAIEQGNAHARLARDKFIYDIKRYIGEYLVLMEGLDALTFTGGIGEHDAALRREVLSSLGFLGLRIDEQGNAADGPVVTTPDSAIHGLVLPTNEEIVVARETLRVIGS